MRRIGPDGVRSRRPRLGQPDGRGRRLLCVASTAHRRPRLEGAAAGLLLDRARAADWLVARDISAIGFDRTPHSEKTLPRLTCVRQPIREMAWAAVRLLLAQIDDLPEGRRDLELPMTLGVRDSTAAPPSNRTGIPILRAEKLS